MSLILIQMVLLLSAHLLLLLMVCCLRLLLLLLLPLLPQQQLLLWTFIYQSFLVLKDAISSFPWLLMSLLLCESCSLFFMWSSIVSFFSKLFTQCGKQPRIVLSNLWEFFNTLIYDAVGHSFCYSRECNMLVDSQ